MRGAGRSDDAVLADLDNQCTQLAEEKKAVDDFMRENSIADAAALRKQWQAAHV